MNIKQLRKLIRETIQESASGAGPSRDSASMHFLRDLHESSFSVNADVDRAFNQVGVYPPKMISVGGSRYEGEIDKGWKLTYDEDDGAVDINGKSFKSLLDAAKFYKQNKGKSPSSVGKNKIARIEHHHFGRTIIVDGKEFNVHDIAEEEYRKNNPDASDDDVEAHVYDDDISHIDTRIMREHGVTHVIDPETFGDEEPRPVEEWL